jgi:hypothetical protein
VADSNVAIAGARSNVADSNVSTANARSNSSFSHLESIRAQLPVLSEAEKDVRQPLADQLARRRASESASQQSGQIPILYSSKKSESSVKTLLAMSHYQHIATADVESLPEDYYVSGIPIDFYCVKDNKYGYITLSAMNKFKPFEY